MSLPKKPSLVKWNEALPHFQSAMPMTKVPGDDASGQDGDRSDMVDGRVEAVTLHPGSEKTNASEGMGA